MTALVRKLVPDDATELREMRLEVPRLRPAPRIANGCLCGGSIDGRMAGMAGFGVVDAAQLRHKGVLGGMSVRESARGGGLESREHHHPWTAPFTDDAGFDAWCGRFLTGPLVGLIARETISGGVVGVMSLGQIVFHAFARSAHLTYHGMVAFAGRGLMTEAVGLATRHAFDTPGLHRLEANIQPDNARAIALVKRLGFRLESLSRCSARIGGEWRDVERWALLADEAG